MKQEPKLLISVRFESREDKETIEIAAKKVQRKNGPFMRWATLEYIKEHPELFQET